jgi:hypothetical protein
MGSDRASTHGTLRFPACPPDVPLVACRDYAEDEATVHLSRPVYCPTVGHWQFSRLGVEDLAGPGPEGFDGPVQYPCERFKPEPAHRLGSSAARAYMRSVLARFSYESRAGGSIKCNRHLSATRVGCKMGWVIGDTGYVGEMRNQVQHRGIRPATDQVPRWLQETEDLIAFIVRASFGVELADVGSASSVADERLRRTLDEAEKFLEAGEAKESMTRSWETLEWARTLLRRRTGLRTGERPLTSRPSDRQGEEIRKQFQALSDQLEVSLFTAEPGEWMWFQQRYQDSQNGLPASAEDARRAFVFVLAWVLRVEGYIARHGPERWEQWQELRAPRTGLPGGPHLQDAWHGRKFPDEGAWEWGFQLTDLPDDFNPDFTWGIQAAQEASKDPLVLYAYLDMTGKLFIRVPEKSDPEQVVEAARGLVAEAKQQMANRAVADQQQLEYEEGLIEPFRIALEKAGCPYKQILAKDATFRGGSAGDSPLVWIELDGVGPHGTTRFPRFLEESFASFFPDADPGQVSFGFDDVAVPAGWQPDTVVEWLLDGKEEDRKWDAARIADIEERERNEEEALSTVRRILNS